MSVSHQEQYIFNAGVLAFVRGEDKDTNPFTGEQWQWWINGWDEAESDPDLAEGVKLLSQSVELRAAFEGLFKESLL